MFKNIVKKSWKEREKYQLLLAYRLGTPIKDIATILQRTEKSVYRALERFSIVSSDNGRGRPSLKKKKKHYRMGDLENIFRECGVSSDLLFDKGFFQKHHGKEIYRPSLEVQQFWEEDLKVKLEAPWIKKKVTGFQMKPYSCSLQNKEYSLQDLLKFMQKMGNVVKQVTLGDHNYFLLKGQRYTPQTLLYCANKIRLQKGLETMCIPGITQD